MHINNDVPYSVVQVHGLHFMVRVLKKLIYKAVGPLKRNDHAARSECAHFFNTCSKRAILKKKTQV